MIIIGDVHGCYETLLRLIDKLPKNEELFFVGDLCDRGARSAEVLEFVIENRYGCVLGNHDILMAKFAQKYLKNELEKENEYWIKNRGYGGKATVKSYMGREELLASHVAWLDTLPVFAEFAELQDIRGRHLFITHGFGLPYYKRRVFADNEESIRTAFLWNRVGNPYGYEWEDVSEYTHIVNVFGHDTFEKPLIEHNHIGIDTGCGYGKKLTALRFPQMEFFDQEVVKGDIS